MRAAYGLKITCFWASHYQVLSLVYCKCACISWNNVYERVDFIIHSSWTLTEWAALSSTLLECHTITDQPLAWILSEFHKLWSCCLLNRVKVFEVKQSSRESSTHHFHCQSPRGFVASAAGFRQGTDNMLNTRDQGQILHSRVTHTHFGPASELKKHTLKFMHLLMAYFSIRRSIILTKQIHCESKSKCLENNM